MSQRTGNSKCCFNSLPHTSQKIPKISFLVVFLKLPVQARASHTVMQDSWRPSTPFQTIPEPTGSCQHKTMLWARNDSLIKSIPQPSSRALPVPHRSFLTSSNPPEFHCVRTTMYMSSEIKSPGAENQDSLQPLADQQALLSKADTASSFQAVKWEWEKGTELLWGLQFATATRSYFPFPFAEHSSEEFCLHGWWPVFLLQHT